MTDDQTLAQPATASDSPLGNPDGPAAAAPAGRIAWTIDDILSRARTPERYAKVCLRGDLEARHEQLVRDLTPLIDAQGTVLDPDEEASLGEGTNASRAQQLAADLATVREEMAQNMWFPLFRGMPSDAMAVFNEAHYPKKETAPLNDYNDRLIATCMVDPVVTVEQVRELRKKLGSRAMLELIKTATEVNTQGGVDIPFSPISSPALKPT